ncbi:hypothetical protein [Polaromonas sp.]|uniref:hypothetical protein n=1 Tax=Polaromonas sp. TaxID=1869339 RepID=UPI00272FF784|nr:hypothetical protein [Polaromonas sp.]
MGKRNIEIFQQSVRNKTSKDSTYTGHSKHQDSRACQLLQSNGGGDEQASVSGNNSGYGSQDLSTLGFKK